MIFVERDSHESKWDRIKATVPVHGKGYLSDDLARIDIGEYINSLADDLRSSYGLGSQDVNLIINLPAEITFDKISLVILTYWL